MTALAPDVASLRFLVVEDQGFQRWAIGRILEQLGATTVFLADDGTSAIELFKTLEPPVDVVVTDLNMPGMDGMEFIRHVGESGIPVSLILASDLGPALVSSVASMTKAYGLTLLDAIQKPVTAVKLAGALARYARPQDKVPPAGRAFDIAEIEVAIAAGEIVPHFQAKVDLRTGAVRGAEALARWLHPRRGLVSPGAFVPQIESAGRGEQLTLALLAGACVASRRWRDAGLPAVVALNISNGALADVTLADRLVAVARDGGVEPRDIVLEVTETAAASDVGRVLENLSRLRMKGFGLAIDDYGTGYASMEQLSRIPFTELKIDQTFVRQAPASSASRAMLESSLEIAAKLGIVAVAEGVETGRELDLLMALDCPAAQGYLLCKPLPAAEFLDWMRRNAAAR
jgi:EAL domain-containing protein (putative c-di-GMP-specific phosphodiesterase class I)/CheY-like chemotaxis protein